MTSKEASALYACMGLGCYLGIFGAIRALNGASLGYLQLGGAAISLAIAWWIRARARRPST